MSSSSSSVSSSLLGNQFTNDIPMTAPLTASASSSSLQSLNLGTSTSSSSVTIDKNLLIQLAKKGQKASKSKDSKASQKVDSMRLPDGSRYTGFVVKGKPNGNGKLI